AATGPWLAVSFSCGLRRGCDDARAVAVNVRGAVVRSEDQLTELVSHSTARELGGRSSPAVCCNKRPRLPRSHPGAPCARRTGNSETVRPAVAAEQAVLRQTSRYVCASSRLSKRS